MAWKDEVMEVVKEMLREAEDQTTNPGEPIGRRDLERTLKGYARTLKAICGSATDPPAILQYPSPSSFQPLHGMGAELQHHLEVEKAKSEFKKVKTFERVEESHDGDGVFYVGGPDDGAMTTIDPNMPIGAKTFAPGGVYKLTQDPETKVRHLEFDEAETERVKLARLARRGGD